MGVEDFDRIKRSRMGKVGWNELFMQMGYSEHVRGNGESRRTIIREIRVKGWGRKMRKYEHN